MRYLKITHCDGIYKYVPLEGALFDFIEVDNNEYRVEMTSVSRSTITLFEKRCIVDIDNFMKRIANLPDGIVIDVIEVFE